MKSFGAFFHRLFYSKPPAFMFKWVWSFTLQANVAEYFAEVGDYSAAVSAAETISGGDGTSNGTSKKRLHHQANLRAPWAASRRLVRLLFTLLSLKLVHLLYLMFVPLDAFHRLLHFDFVYLLGCPQMTNILPVTVCAVILFSFYTLYRFDFCSTSIEQIRPMQRVAALIEKVYYRGDDSVFLFKNNVTGRRSFKEGEGENVTTTTTSVESIRNGTKLYMFIIRYTNDFIIAHYVFFQVYLAMLFIMDGDFYFTLLKGVASMATILLAESTILLLINSAASIIAAVFMINFIFSSVVFKRFRQAELLLEGSTDGGGSTGTSRNRSIKRRAAGGLGPRLPHLFNATLFGLFARHHTQTLLMVLYNNHAYGRCVTAFIVTFVFSNSYLTQLIVKGEFNVQATVFLGNYVLLQWVLIVGFHLLAANYCERIHCCAKPLMKASTTTTSAANSFLRRRGGVQGGGSGNGMGVGGMGVSAGAVQQPLQQSATSVRYVTTLALYVEKFHTEHEYGMTYFDLGLISLKTFVKFVFIYCEIFIYVYQLKSS